MVQVGLACLYPDVMTPSEAVIIGVVSALVVLWTTARWPGAGAAPAARRTFWLGIVVGLAVACVSLVL